MEKLPVPATPDAALPASALSGAAPAPTPRPTVSTDWRDALPVLAGATLTLRELEPRDAPSLLAMLSSDEVARFFSRPPTTVDGFERFIRWTHEQRQSGEYVCFAVVPHGTDVAVGLFQLRRLDRTFGVAEWGFALASAYWGTGIFLAAARLTIDFAIDTLGVYRLEARAAVANGRGNAALKKLGAVLEGRLRQSFHRDGKFCDQLIWSIIDTDWVTFRQFLPHQIRVH